MDFKVFYSIRVNTNSIIIHIVNINIYTLWESGMHWIQNYGLKPGNHLISLRTYYDWHSKTDLIQCIVTVNILKIKGIF